MDPNPYQGNSLESPWSGAIPPAAAERLQQAILTLRIIVFSLAAGVTAFMAFVIVQNVGKPHTLAGNLEPLNLVGIAMGLAMLPMGLVLPSIIFRQMPASPGSQTGGAAGDPQVAAVLAIQGRWQTAAIIGAAMLEGAAFVNIFAYFQNCELSNLILAAVLLIGILAFFPLPGSCERRIERELRR